MPDGRMCCDAEKAITVTVPPSSQLPLPLQFVNSEMHVRPSNWSLHWCLAPIRWQEVTQSAEPYNSDCSCDMLGGPSNAYRYSSLIKATIAVAFRVNKFEFRMIDDRLL